MPKTFNTPRAHERRTSCMQHNSGEGIFFLNWEKVNGKRGEERGETNLWGQE